MVVLQIFGRQHQDSKSLDDPSATVVTEILPEVRFCTTHSEPAEVEGGWVTVHKRLRGVAEFINQLNSIAEQENVILDSVGFIKSDSPKVADFKEEVTLHKVTFQKQSSIAYKRRGDSQPHVQMCVTRCKLVLRQGLFGASALSRLLRRLCPMRVPTESVPDKTHR